MHSDGFDHYEECDVCSERFWFADGERSSGWTVEIPVPGGCRTVCHSCNQRREEASYDA